MNTISAPDLTQRPPRSPRVCLGGYSILPRVLDKARATVVGKQGEYIFNNPTDTLFFKFVGITQEDLLEQVRTGAGDWQVFEWVKANANQQRAPYEIESWNQWVAQRGPSDIEDREYFNEVNQKFNPAREDLRTWFDYLDLDDSVSFGGQA